MGNLSLGIFRAPELRWPDPPGCYSTSKCPGIIWLNILQVEYPKYSNVDIALIKVKEEFKGGIYGTLRLPRKDRTLPGMVYFLYNNISF